MDLTLFFSYLFFFTSYHPFSTLVADAGASSTSTWLLWFDGASCGASKIGSCGIVIHSPLGSITLLGILLGENISNNMAEYQALLLGLRALHLLGATRVDIKGDSQLVIHQIKGISRTLNPLMHYYCQHAHDLLSSFSTYTLSYLPRQANTMADSMACMALSGSFTQNFDRTLVTPLSFHFCDPWDMIQNVKLLGIEGITSQLRSLQSAHPSLWERLVLSLTHRLIYLSDVTFLITDPIHLLMVL